MTSNEIPESRGATEPSGQPAAKRAGALQRMITELLAFSNEDRRMLIETLMTFFGLGVPTNGPTTDAKATLQPSLSGGRAFQFSEEHDKPSPKSFMLDKSPKTDVERVACLAYYLARYRGIPHFATKDITAINIESAQRRFSNTADAVENATKMGYVVPSVKGSKQLSATGEQFVEALPDRDMAKEILDRARHRRGRRQAKKNNTKAERE